jgi:hypothetical protein
MNDLDIVDRMQKVRETRGTAIPKSAYRGECVAHNLV